MKSIKNPTISTKSDDSRWVAVDIITGEVLAEGKTPEEATKKANTEKSMLLFVPKKGETYIF